MGRRHMFTLSGKTTLGLGARVRSLPGSLVEDFNRFFGGPDHDFLALQGIGHAVEVLVEGHVIVNVHPSLFPTGELVGPGR
jgi:hypothetical protein